MTQSSDWAYPGSRWWKFDFHTHTPASHDTVPWQNVIGTSDEVTPEKWLLKYMEAGLDCVAITDHNSGAWVNELQETYANLEANPPTGFRKLHIFPGVEISVNGGFHLLAIFGPSTTTSDIDTLLGNVEYAGTKGDSDGVTRKGGADVVQAVLDAGGIPIPAHVEQTKGLLCSNYSDASSDSPKALLDANTLLQILTHRNILAMEREDCNINLPGIYGESQARWAEVVGSDSHTFQGTAVPGSRYTWVKMAVPTLEGLRLALLDGNEISLRRWDEAAFEPFRLPEHFIEEVEIGGAKFMGNGKAETLGFSPYFNAIIGGRGTGKSTIVHALRLAYRRESELNGFDEKSEPRHTFEQFNRLPQTRFDRGGLRLDTRVTATLLRDGVRHRLCWQKDGQGTVVEEWDGQTWCESVSQAVSAERFPLRLFSQGQIAAMAVENRQALLTVIDEAANLHSQKQTYEEAKQVFFSLRAEFRLLESRLTGREEVQRKLEEVQRKITKLEQSKYSEELKAFQSLHCQDDEVKTRFEQFATLHQRIRTFTSEIRLGDIPVGTFDQSVDADVLIVLGDLRKSVGEAVERIRSIADEMKLLEESARSNIGLKTWQERLAAQDEKYEALKATLAEQGVKDPNEFANLIRDKVTLQTQTTELEAVETRRDTLAESIREQQKVILAARQEITNARQYFLQTYLAKNSYVHIDIEPFGYDLQTLEHSLRECLEVTDDRFQSDILEMDGNKTNSGLISKLLKSRERLIALNSIKRELIKGSDDQGAKFRNYLNRKLENQPEFADHIETWFPEDDLRIQYSRRGDGKEFQPIAQGSAGQRAAAILAFLLAFGEEPLVLDQPEDDLDNHLIYDLVVQQIRANKLRRQLVIVSHNPNIVVNGDAEMVHVFDFGSQCYTNERGALQEKTVRDEVCRVMEGGPDAFARRWQRLGKEL